MHTIEPNPKTLHGHFSRDLLPILTINSGETVRYRTLDAAWCLFDHPDPFSKPAKFPHDRERDPGHALCGPIYINGAKADMMC